MGQDECLIYSEQAIIAYECHGHTFWQKSFLLRWGIQGRKKGNVLFKDALNTFYSVILHWIYHKGPLSERRNLLLLHGLFFPSVLLHMHNLEVFPKQYTTKVPAHLACCISPLNLYNFGYFSNKMPKKAFECFLPLCSLFAPDLQMAMHKQLNTRLITITFN